MSRAALARRKALLLMAAALLAAGVGVAAYATNLLRRTELQSIDARFSIRGRQPTPNRRLSRGDRSGDPRTRQRSEPEGRLSVSPALRRLGDRQPAPSGGESNRDGHRIPARNGHPRRQRVDRSSRTRARQDRPCDRSNRPRGNHPRTGRRTAPTRGGSKAGRGALGHRLRWGCAALRLCGRRAA